jgi:hypothetical protein
LEQRVNAYGSVEMLGRRSLRRFRADPLDVHGFSSLLFDVSNNEAKMHPDPAPQ